MLTEKGPRVLEYNARFGDPETQVVLPRMKNDIVDVFEACVDGTLDQIELEFEDNAAVCVVLASDGYPVKYEKGYKIKGLENFKDKDGYYVFHAGSKFDADGNIVTNGGRVLGVTATGKDLKAARANAYQATEWIEFDNKYMRHDIGKAIDEASIDEIDIFMDSCVLTSIAVFFEYTECLHCLFLEDEDGNKVRREGSGKGF